jgi:hypothetical protein
MRRWRRSRQSIQIQVAAMNTPQPNPSQPPQRREADDVQMRSWLRLRGELAELNARLEYLRLIVSLGVRRIG